jgi:preprotein translocase subunit SecD
MRNRSNTLIAVLLMLAVGAACSLLRPKRPLTWHVTLQIDSPEPDRFVNQTVVVIQKRLDGLGINFKVQPQGSHIVVDLPDVPDRERLKNLIASWGKLELTHVISPPSPAPAQTFVTKEEAIASLNDSGRVPLDRRVLPYIERTELTASPSNANAPKPQKWVVVESPAIIDGSELRTANAVQARGGGSEDFQIQFTLKKNGADKFGEWTGTHINEYLGVVLNDEVKSIAYIKSQISDSGEITGRFSKQSAEDLALTLRSGVLPAPIKIVEEGANK